MLKASIESALDLAADLNNKDHKHNGKNNHHHHRQQKKQKDGSSEHGIYSEKSYDQISEESVVIKKKSKKTKDMTFAKRVRPSESDSDSESKTDKSTSVKPAEDNRPYNKVKHIFEI